MRQSLREVDRIAGVALPELALDIDLASQVVQNLADAAICREMDLELFITGIAVPPAPSSRSTRDQRIPSSPLPRNAIYGCTFIPSLETDERAGRLIPIDWYQFKHHRWKLDRSQVMQYQISDRLAPDHSWWEHIDVSRRKCIFRVFRDGACLAALVCEDLARIDPVQSVIRSVGPNLVIALLMDGTQIPVRWAARYATVLADDPGSSVLTLTSLGLIRRSATHEPAPAIGLWKSASDAVRKLELPAGYHALLLSLKLEDERTCTLDGRSDEGTTVKLVLDRVLPIRHPNPPPWADVD